MVSRTLVIVRKGLMTDPSSVNTAGTDLEGRQNLDTQEGIGITEKQKDRIWGLSVVLVVGVLLCNQRLWKEEKEHPSRSSAFFRIASNISTRLRRQGQRCLRQE